MALNFRQLQLYTFVVSLYRPAPLVGIPGDTEAQDAAFQAPAAYTGVKCYYQATPEFTNVTLAGLNKEENVFTSDKWYFDAAQEINDGWLIVLTGTDRPGNPYIGRCWITQGNAQVNVAAGGRNANNCWVYAKLSPTMAEPESE